jgi:hypothetical protein
VDPDPDPEGKNYTKNKKNLEISCLEVLYFIRVEG